MTGERMKKVNRLDVRDLRQIPNVGPAIAAMMQRIGIESPQGLLGQDPYHMYDVLCDITGRRHDPCVLDVFIAAVRFMNGAAAQPWWKYTPERKRMLADRMHGS